MTEYSLQKLVGEMDVKINISKDLFSDVIYPDGRLYDLLNSVERKNLFKYAMLLKDETKFAATYYRFVPEEPDAEQLVFSKGGKTKYHLNADCEMLTKDFKDFNIPSEISELGSDAVSEFRKWFKDMCFKEKLESGQIALDRINREFNNRYVIKYGIQPLDEESGILVVEKENSSKISIENSFDVLKCKQEIELCLREYNENFRVYESQKVAKHSYLLKLNNKEIMAKLKEILPNTPITEKNFDKIVQDLRLASQITRNIIQLVKSYIRWTYNFENKDFNNVTLEDFGLECCQVCLKNNI